LESSKGERVKNGLIVANTGTKEWWCENMRHREDGPAIERIDGTKVWYHHGQLHREDGASG